MEGKIQDREPAYGKERGTELEAREGECKRSRPLGWDGRGRPSWLHWGGKVPLGTKWALTSETTKPESIDGIKSPSHFCFPRAIATSGCHHTGLDMDGGMHLSSITALPLLTEPLSQTYNRVCVSFICWLVFFKICFVVVICRV